MCYRDGPGGARHDGISAPSFFGIGIERLQASASGMPTNCFSTLARSRAKRGMRTAYHSLSGQPRPEDSAERRHDPNRRG